MIRVIFVTMILVVSPFMVNSATAALPSFEYSCPEIKPVDGVRIAASLDCSTIFVYPPSTGTITVSTVTTPDNEEVCKQFLSFDRSATLFAEKSLQLIDEGLAENNIEKTQLGLEHQASAKSTADLASPYYEDFGSRVNVLLEMDWQTGLEKVKAKNPSITVREIPIVSAQLVYLSNVKAGKRFNHLLQVSVPGIQNKIDTYKSGKVIEGEPNQTEGGDFSTVSMGAALAGTMVFSLPAICYEEIINGDSFSGNLVYSIPVQTRSYLEISMDLNFVAEKIVDRIYSVNGQEITLNDVTEELVSINNAEGADDAVLFSVKASDGIPLPPGAEGEGFTIKDLQDEYEAMGLETLAKSILDQVGRVINAEVELPAVAIDGVDVVQKTRRACKRRWFRKKCHNVTYSVNVPKEEIEKVTRKVAAEINFSTAADFEKLNTFLTIDTSAFVPVKE